MDSGLPFNLDDLVHRRAIESHRVEFKAVWNPTVKASVVRTICAFANDALHLNGGYVILGIEEREGRPVLPPRGLDELDLERVQREIRGACNTIEPGYPPYCFPADLEGRSILILWVPGGDNRPYQVPENVQEKGSRRHYYLRRGPETVQARGDFLRQLLELTAKVPFDDRRHLDGRLEDISPDFVRRFLRNIGSKLVEAEPAPAARELYRKLRLTLPVNSHEAPRNVALLFFHEDPERFFPGARIEVVYFPQGAAGDVIDERVFRGPLPQQVREALQYLESYSGTLIRKIPGQPEAEHAAAYPYEAVEEVLANGVYHRGYNGPPEPLKVYLYPDRMEVITYPGPVLGLEPEHFEAGAEVPPVSARNRRIGEFLKELRLAEGRGTGLPKIRRAMALNGSPAPRFDFDEPRSYFRVTLPIHPRHLEVIEAEKQGVAPVLDPGPVFDLEVALGKLRERLVTGEISLEEYREIKAEVLSRS